VHAAADIFTRHRSGRDRIGRHLVHNGTALVVDDAALAKTVEQGANVIIVKDKTPWQKAMAPVWDQYSVKIPDGKELIIAIGAL
jgi:TRAP-type C4-dicarboxylate transport system substrate-binding protein